MKNGNIIFFGTPELCNPFLDELNSAFEIKLVITQPDKVGQRHNKYLPPAVKQYAIQHNLPYIQPESLRSNDIYDKIKHALCEIGVVIAYGRFIPISLINIPKHKMINVHFSMLPAYRGAAPVQRAIENNEHETGITIFELDEHMDTGDILSQKRVPIHSTENAQQLFSRMQNIGVPLLIETILGIFSGNIIKKSQSNEYASFAPAINKAEGEISWNMTAQQIFNKFRAFLPWPGVFFYLNNTRIKIISASIAQQTTTAPPGTVFINQLHGFQIACLGGSMLEVNTIQPENKKAMSALQYALGHSIPGSLN